MLQPLNEEKPFEEMTVQELKTLAKSKSVIGYSSMSKAQLIDILRVTE